MQKVTVVPVHRAEWNLPQETHVDLGHGISFENVEGLLKPQNFDLWKQYVSEDARKQLAKARFALVHRFTSSDHIGGNEQESIDLMNRVFILLRVIKPTRSHWSNIQFKDSPGGVDVFSFSNPKEQLPIMPEAETFNEINLHDVRRLTSLLEPFLRIVDDGPLNVRRAIRHYDLAYSGIDDPMIQFVTWMMALEQFYSHGEEPERRSVLLNKISQYIDLDTDIYAGTQFRSLTPNVSPITARQTLRDLFVLRSRFVHGLWVKKEWLAPARESITSQPSTYADVLREVASWLVRTSIIRYLEIGSNKND